MLSGVCSKRSHGKETHAIIATAGAASRTCSRQRCFKRSLCIQPDGVIESPGVYGLLEAKRIKRGAFEPEQLAREYLAVVQEAQGQGRKPLLLLVLPAAPPVAVKGHGRVEIDKAVANFLEPVRLRCEHEFPEVEMLLRDVSSVIAYTTWPALVDAITAGLSEFSSGDASFDASVKRVATAALSAINWHGK